jgi:hypothetical protein
MELVAWNIVVSLRDDEETQRSHGYQRNLLNLSTPPKNRATVRLSIISQRRLATTALLGLAPARSTRASAANHRESVSACRRDDLGDSKR